MIIKGSRGHGVFGVVSLFCLIVIIFLRFWKVTDLFHFGFNEEHQAFLAWEQVKNFHPIWIGVSAANINYYLGPAFTYLNALLFFFSKGNPEALAYFSAFWGIVTVISIFCVIRNIFSKEVALFSALVYGGSSLMNLYDRKFWNPSPIPFVTVWYLYSLIKANEDTRWYILSSILLGFFFHFHLSLLVLLFPTVISVLKNIRKINIGVWAFSIICYLMVTSPMIVFDLNHNFDNLLMPIRMITGEKKPDLYSPSIRNIIGHFGDFYSAMGRMWFVGSDTSPRNEVAFDPYTTKTRGNSVLSFVSLAMLFIFVSNNRKGGYEILNTALVSFVIAFICYPSYNPEYYLLSFLTIMSIVIGYVLNIMPKAVSLGITISFLLCNVLTMMTLSDEYGLMNKKTLIKRTMEYLGDNPFTLQTEGALPEKEFTYAGWRYLFKAYGSTPVKSNIDNVLGWIYPDEIDDNTAPRYKVVIAEDFKLSNKEVAVAKFSSKKYDAYIFDNSSR